MRAHADDLLTVFGFFWAALLFATAAVNRGVASCASPAAWAWFIGISPIASKLALFVVQNAVIRTIVRRRIRAGREMEPPCQLSPLPN